MENKIIEKIKKHISDIDSPKQDKPYFADKRYISLPTKKENFHNITDQKSEKSIAFVDGGNTEVISTPSLSLQLVRVYATIYKNNKRIKSIKKESFVLITSKTINSMKYSVDIFNKELIDSSFDFDYNDETLRKGKHNVIISEIGEAIRRLAELSLINELTKDLKSGIIVRDGTLQSSVTHESKFFKEIYEKALQNNTVICSLAKSCTILTENGSSFTNILAAISPKGRWYYHPVAQIDHPDHQAELYFVKLHNNSKHIFRFEVYKQNQYNIDELVSLLSLNSKDPVFLGYPYGLIEADRFARVTNREKEYYKTILASKLNLDIKQAHDILDNIS